MNFDDRPSVKDLKKQIKAASLLVSGYKMVRLFGLRNKSFDEAVKALDKLKSDLSKMKNQFNKFNELFNNRGWLAYDHLSSTLIEEVLITAESKSIADAERLLIKYHTSEEIYSRISWLRGIEVFAPRIELIRLAVIDSKERRFHAAIPVVLMMIDGVVNDVVQTGFFSEKTDLKAWDSFAAHDNSLKQISEMFSSKRNKTNSEQLTIPYRNGILHGRDLGYYNETTMSKSWAMLFTVADYVKSKVVEEKNIDEYNLKSAKESNLPLQLSELKKTIIDYTDQQTRHERQKELIENWTKRSLSSQYLKSLSFQEASPEATVLAFVSYWRKMNYGKMAELTTELYDQGESVGKKAGLLKRTFLRYNCKGVEFVGIKDESPAISVIELKIETEEPENKPFNHQFRVVFVSKEGNPLPRGESYGRWLIINTFYKDL